MCVIIPFQTALHLAVLTKQPNVIEQLMGADADANVQDRNGQTAIHLCAANGDLGCLTQIMNKKPKNLDLEIKNFNGLTALHLAVQKKHLGIVDALIQYGANTNAKVTLLYNYTIMYTVTGGLCKKATS